MNQVAVALTCPETVAWVKDADCIIVVNERRGESHILRGEEAALWSWLMLAYPYPKLARLLAELLALPPAEAKRQLAVFLQGWRIAGLLEEAERPHG